jgi:hypothetical protein
MAKARQLPRSFTMPWGNGQVIDEVGLPTEHNELVIQLLRYDDEAIPDSVRFCQYWHDGRFQRQPMMISEADLPGMRAALSQAPALLGLLRRLVAE